MDPFRIQLANTQQFLYTYTIPTRASAPIANVNTYSIQMSNVNQLHIFFIDPLNEKETYLNPYTGEMQSPYY